jgi:hypothetical protein
MATFVLIVYTEIMVNITLQKVQCHHVMRNTQWPCDALGTREWPPQLIAPIVEHYCQMRLPRITHSSNTLVKYFLVKI